MQRVRGLISGSLVGVPLGLFMILWLHAVVWAAALGGGIVGLAIFTVVATRSDSREQAADTAWREAAPDLPPVSDRVKLESLQANLPGPGDGGLDAKPSAAPDQGSEPS